MSIGYQAEKTSYRMLHETLKQINTLLAEQTPKINGYLGGRLGRTLYYFIAGKYQENKVLTSKANACLNEVFADLNGECKFLHGYNFSGGVAGFAYEINYLQKQGYIDFDCDNDLTDIDTFICNAALKEIEEDNIDFLHGAFGALHYFTSRDKSDLVIRQFVARLCEAITARAIDHPTGIYFQNRSLERLQGAHLADLGLAHGLSGMLLILLEAVVFLDEPMATIDIIKKGISFILSLKQVEGERNFYPNIVNLESGESQFNARMAWCYGDGSVLLLLHRAGRILLQRVYTEEAEKLAPFVLARNTVTKTLLDGSHFCHGSAGLAQLYRALYKETEEYKYYQAYEHWVRQTVELAQQDLNRNTYAESRHSLLDGWVGVALVLTEYAKGGAALTWGKSLLL